MHAIALVSEYYPRPHGVGLIVAVVAHMYPAGHARQSPGADLPANLLYFPAAQDIYAELPRGQ